MTPINFNKKEKPLTSLLSMGGGAAGMQFGGGGADKSYIEEIYSTDVWYGDDTPGRVIDNGVDLAGKGGLTWIKRRTSAGGNHCFFDTERGAGKLLIANSSAVESTSNNRMSAFNDNGFTIGSDSGTNRGNDKYASWSFRKQKGFFDVVKYEGNGNDNRQIAHDLGTRPGMIWIKRIDNAIEEWQVWHRNANNAYCNNIIDGTFFQFTRQGSDYTTERWGTNGMQATDTHFTIGTSVTTNISGSNFIAYVFAHNTSCKNNVPTAYVKAAADPMPWGTGNLTMANGPFSNNANGSVHFDGNTTLHIPCASKKDRLDQSNQTIECWFRLDSGALSAENVIFCKWGRKKNGNGHGTTAYRMSYQFSVESSGRTVWRLGDGAANGSFQTMYGSTTIQEETWYHVAITKDSGMMKMYINGSFEVQLTGSYGGNAGDNWPHILGGYGSWGDKDEYGISLPMSGRISNFRYNNTECLYTSNFTPATSNLTLTSQGADAAKVNILCCNGVHTWGDETKGNIHGDDEDQEVIKCGIWSGKGAVVNLGWQPQVIMWKAMTDGPGSHGRWFINDKMRGYYDANQNDRLFHWDNDAAELDASVLYPLTYGFYSSSGGDYAGNANQNGPYVYMAIRDVDTPVRKPVENGTDVFFMDVGDSSQTNTTLPAFKTQTSSPYLKPDWMLYRQTNGGDNWKQGSRQTRTYYNETNTINLPQGNSNSTFDYQNGWGGYLGDMTTTQSWMWKNWKGAQYLEYMGNGVNNTAIPHNMGQTPEMIWCKYQQPGGTSGNNWMVYHKDMTAGYHMFLNTSGGEINSNTPNFNTFGPKYFQIGSFGAINHSGNAFACMLFSSVDKICKVDHYIGNGQTLSNGKYVNCGFQPRFIILKHTGSGHWFVFDSIRGFGTPGQNTISLRLDENGTSNGSTYVEPDANGFRVVDDSPQVNALDNKYLYYAHA